MGGWEGDKRAWSVEEGCLVGRRTNELRTGPTTYLRHDGVFADFDLSFEIKVDSRLANSGVQYRSQPGATDEGDGFDVSGYQADFDGAHQYTGILYEQNGRGITVGRGKRVRISPNRSMTQLRPAFQTKS